LEAGGGEGGGGGGGRRLWDSGLCEGREGRVVMEREDEERKNGRRTRRMNREEEKKRGPCWGLPHARYNKTKRMIIDMSYCW